MIRLPISTRLKTSQELRHQDGYALMMVIFFVALVLVATMVAAPRILLEGKREKEQEMIWRGKQYVRGVKLYYRKTGRFPTSVDDLIKPKTGSLRFMRQAYKDPMNRTDGSWRLIYVGPSGQLIGSLKPPQTLQLPAGGGLGTAASSLAGNSQQPGAQQPGSFGSSAFNNPGTGGSGTFGSATSGFGATSGAATPGSGAQGGVASPAGGGTNQQGSDTAQQPGSQPNSQPNAQTGAQNNAASGTPSPTGATGATTNGATTNGATTNGLASGAQTGTQPGAQPDATTEGSQPQGTDAPAETSNALSTPQPITPTDSPTIIGGNIIGVGSKMAAPSVIVYEKAKNYRLFEFIWDPSKDATIAGQPGMQPLTGLVQPFNRTTFGQQPGQAHNPTTFGQQPASGNQNPQQSQPAPPAGASPDTPLDSNPPPEQSPHR